MMTSAYATAMHTNYMTYFYKVLIISAVNTTTSCCCVGHKYLDTRQTDDRQTDREREREREREEDDRHTNRKTEKYRKRTDGHRYKPTNGQTDEQSHRET